MLYRVANLIQWQGVSVSQQTKSNEQSIFCMQQKVAFLSALVL
jgi:hypothetical protein